MAPWVRLCKWVCVCVCDRKGGKRESKTFPTTNTQVCFFYLPFNVLKIQLHYKFAKNLPQNLSFQTQ